MPGKLPKLPTLPKPGKLPGLPTLKKAKPSKPAPIDAEFGGVSDLERRTEAELGEMLEGFKARAAREQQRFEEATDSFHYTTVVFQNRAQVEAFLRAIGEPADALFVDGQALACRMGVDLPEARVLGRLGKVERELAQMSLEE